MLVYQHTEQIILNGSISMYVFHIQQFPVVPCRILGVIGKSIGLFLLLADAFVQKCIYLIHSTFQCENFVHFAKNVICFHEYIFNSSR